MVKPSAPAIFRRPKGILFDHDGVLVSSEELHFLAWQQLIKDIGLRFEDIDFHSLVGRSAPQILEIILNRLRPGWKREDYDLDALALRKNDYYLEYARTQLAPYPGVREGLRWCQENGIRCAIVSNAKRRELEYSVQALKLAPFFGAIVSRDDVVRPKPDPAPYEFGAFALGLSPWECVAIDDSPTGLQSALLAKAVAVSVTSNFPRHALEYPIPGRPDLRPSFIARSMVEFFEWLRNLPAD